MMFVFLFKFLVGNRKLCEAPYNKTVDWAKWYIFWADERVVAKTHADSNYKLAKDGLLSKVCAFVCFLYIFQLSFIYMHPVISLQKDFKGRKLQYFKVPSLVKHLLHFDFLALFTK